MQQTNKHIESIEEHIRFLEKVIKKPSISVSSRHKLSENLDTVKKRYADPNLYLAVIGEFSSGKSTFINALLRDDLLKTSSLVTTATATTITYGNTLRADASFTDTRPEQFIEASRQTLRGAQSSSIKKSDWITSLGISTLLTIIVSAAVFPFVAALLIFPITLVVIAVITKEIRQGKKNVKGSKLNNKIVSSEDASILGISPKDFVHMVTSEEDLATALNSFTIYHPARFLQSGIITIDTPGTNADNERHGDITQSVVEHIADAAVIVIPAGQPVSDTLINFLAKSLQPYIHQCVFVVTKMDSIRLKERPRLLKSIRKRLTNKLGVEQLFLIESAPQIVMDIMTGEEEVPDEQRCWNDQFLEVERKLREHLENSRDTAISQKVERLLIDVFRQSEHHLEQQKQHFLREQKTLNREIIKDLPSFTSTQYAECASMIKDAVETTKRKIDKLVARCQDDAKEELHKIVFSADGKGRLKKNLEAKVSPVFVNARSSLDEELKVSITELDKLFAEVKSHFDQKFSRQYENLKALSTNANLAIQSGTSKNIQVNSSNITAAASRLSKVAGDRSNVGVGLGAGAGTGAAIGTVILPGVGTVVGAALGSVLGGLFGNLFGPSLSELKNSSWNELKPKISDYFLSAEKAVTQSIESYSHQMNSALNSHIDAYIETYQKIVTSMQDEQENKRKRLHKLQKDIEADLSEIHIRINSIEKKNGSSATATHSFVR